MDPEYELSLATEGDIDDCMSVVVPVFSVSPFGRKVIGVDSLTTRQRTGQHHVNAWRDHERRYPPDATSGPTMCPLKIVHIDLNDRLRSRVVGFAEWYICPRPRTSEQVATPLYLHEPAHLDAEIRHEFGEWIAPFVAARREFMGTRPHAMLMYLCVLPEHRRKGLAARLVRWGMERCDELGIEGYLLASEEGKGVYASLGWKQRAVLEGDAPAAVMIYTPSTLNRN